MLRLSIISLFAAIVGLTASIFAQYNLTWNHGSDFGRAIVLLATGFMTSSTNESTVPLTADGGSTVASLTHEIIFTGGHVQGCEDVFLVPEKSFAILSCDRGRDVWNPIMGVYGTPDTSGSLFIYDYSDSSTPLADESRLKAIRFVAEDGTTPLLYPFHPLGTEYDSSSKKLFVIDRSDCRPGHGPYIHVLTLNHETGLAKLEQSLSHPHLLHAPNSITFRNDNELFVTNDHADRAMLPPSRDSSLSFSFVKGKLLWYGTRIKHSIETYFALPGGSISHINLNTGVIRRVASGIPFANGIVVLKDLDMAETLRKCGVPKTSNISNNSPSFLIVAATSVAQIYVYSLENFESGASEQPQLIGPIDRVNVPFFIDNLYLDPCTKGLTMGGHHNPLALQDVSLRLASHSPIGNETVTLEERREFVSKSPGSALRWDMKDYQGPVLDTDGNHRRVRDIPLELIYQTGLVKGVTFGGVTGAAWDSKRSIGIVSSLTENGILIWQNRQHN